MKQRKLIIDGMNTAFKAYYAFKKLTNNGVPVSIVYGMPQIVAAYVKAFGKENTIIVWEGKRSKYRKALLPQYKTSRKLMDEDEREAMFKQMATVKELFGALGVYQLRCPEHEADDTIAYLTRMFRNHSITILSEDKDFFQLIKPGIKVILSTKGKTLHCKNFERETGLTPKQHLDFLCMIGDTSDNIPGAKGIGEVTARALLLKYGSIKNFLASGDSFPRVDRDHFKITYPIMRKLISLKHYQNKTIKGKIPGFGIHTVSPLKPINLKKVKQICKAHNIKSIIQPKFLRVWE